MVEWYKKAAINGNAEAQFQLGLLYADGELPDGDWDTGMYWVEKAAEQGHQQAGIVLESMENEYYSIGC
jgi:TPR repeat protein